MKKIDNKGMGHHMLLILVTVVAVIGIVGYFVWDRQQSKNIDAKAAGYPDLTAVSKKLIGDSTEATFTGCKIKDKKSDSYYLDIIVIKNTKSKVTVAAGYYKNDKKVTSKKTSSFSGNIKALGKFKVKLSDKGWYSTEVGVRDTQPLINNKEKSYSYSEREFQITNVPDCL